MAEKKRGVLLTTFAVLFALLALSNFSKPFSHDPQTSFIFLGARTAGTTQAILASLFGIFLVIYAAGIWLMRRWALPMAYAFAAWVVVNMVMFGARNPQPPGQLLFGLMSIVIGVGVSAGAAVVLRRRQTQLT